MIQTVNQTADSVFIRNGFVSIPEEGISKPSPDVVGTIFANLAYYGYVLSKQAVEKIMILNDPDIAEWWETVDVVLRDVTGDSREMGKYVVYKNFPKEVLEMSQAHYWFNQVCMYVGLPNEWFATEEIERASSLENKKLKVLHLATNNTSQDILNSLFASTVKWNWQQKEDVLYLVSTLQPEIAATSIPFKENLISVITEMMNTGQLLQLKSATDVLRLAVVLSGGEINNTNNIKFKKFNKSQRRYFLGLLEKATNLDEDMARDVERWKRFMYQLHVASQARKYPITARATNKLYNNDVHSFSSKIETGILEQDLTTLEMLVYRPGEFMRRLNKLALTYPDHVLLAYEKVVGKLTVGQLLKINKYLRTYTTRSYRLFAPKGNWSKVQKVDNDGPKMKEVVRRGLLLLTNMIITVKMNEKFPDGVMLDEKTKNIKLSGSDTASYGRGTVFPIPDEVKFIRTASYWENKGNGSNWFDNGWNFFDANWSPMGTICWDSTSITGHGAVFSGDPTNSKEMSGKACQMIDLYPDVLVKNNVRYAVWNVLCFSKIKFSDATDVFAALQWGVEPQAGNLFEPSRCQVSFPLKDSAVTKYVAYIDLHQRKLVFMDANFKANVYSAKSNIDMLSEKMPAFVEYLETIPTVFDLFEGVHEGVIPVVYSDKDESIVGGDAYVFKPENEENSFKQIDLNSLLTL